ncbi:hypothetical protein MA05_04605 [Comamonas aquatica]|uniref:beta strand repeat-containing protein n=1 Tax=Comamonas aquatica TaxID=225991 RepID=UPI0005ECE48B|nr:hypothetical protein [Comamonas aquatica]ANY61513.1 hypothetical protein MA05_04605 [Comamonas aquatica]
MFDAAPGAQYLEEFTSAFLALGNDYAALATALGNTSAFKSQYPSSLTVEETANKFLGSLGLANNTEAQDFVQSKLNAGEGIASVVFQALQALVDYAGDDAELQAAQTQLANKAAVAEYYSVTLGASSDQLAVLQGVVANVTADPASVEAAKEASNGSNGQTYMLTKGLDNPAATSGNDTFIGAIDNVANSELNTLSSQDIINGGAGTDTLKIAHGGTAATTTLGNLSNVEIVEIESSSTGGVTVDSSNVAGVTNLNVTKAAGAVAATAAATTDVSVSIKDSNFAAATDHTVTNGNNVTFNFTDAGAALVANADDIAITGAKGNVVVNATAKAAANTAATLAMGTIGVTGGKTISITQKVGDASGLVAGDAATTHNQGNVTATANAETTTITIKQAAAATPESVKAVAKVDEVATVTFTKLTSGQSVTVSGLTFTASKDLTAEQVAAAFANLSATAPTPANLTNVTAAAPNPATGDTNGGNALANGVFTGTLLAKWSSAAASGNTVTFTASGAMGTDLAVSGTGATVVTTTQGVNAITGKNTLGVTNGTVTIAGAAALKTVTVDGYAASTNTAGITGATNTALDTISLANGGNFEIDSAAATLGLTLANVNGTVDVQAGTKTLNAAVSHAKATETSTLVSASAETVNVTGTGNVAGNTATGLTAATAINTSGMTAGKATFTIADGTKTSYTGGAGVDTVTVQSANIAITKAIDLGAGDDKLTLEGSGSTTVAVPTANLNGGAGTNTIAMSGASAAALSANGDFAAKIDNFQKLEITDTANAATTINMANMDGIKYVVSKGGNAVAGVTGSKQVFVFDIAGLAMDNSGSGSLKAGDATLFTATAGTAVTDAQIATAIGTTATVNGVVYNITKSGTTITLTSAANVAPQAGIAVVAAGAGTVPPTSAAVTTTPGVADVTAGTSYLTIDKMANDGTLELVAASSGAVVKMADATGSADSFNIVTKVDASPLTFGTVEVAGVETLKLNAVDTAPVVDATATPLVPSIQTASLTVKADKATSLTIEGNSNVTLTLDATTTKLATIDAGTLTGNLIAGNSHAGVNTIAMTITGGKGADQLKASVGTNAKADVLNGGDGNDTLYAGSNGAKLTGGEGNDLFIVTATGTGNGNKESNTYSDILDFKAGDLLQLQYSNSGTTADVTNFAKLAATLNENTAVFSDFVNAAIKEANLGQAVYFNYKGDAYVVVDSQAQSAGDVFINGEDLVVKLTGINGDNLSWNSDYATVALV